MRKPYADKVDAANRKYAAVPFDGEELPTTSAGENELIMRKAERQLSSTPPAKAAHDVERKVVTVDKRTEDSENAVRDFLKVPRTAKFDYPEVIERFLKLIVDFTKLAHAYHDLQLRYNRLREQRPRTLQSAAPTWN